MFFGLALHFAAVSESMKQLLAIMHGPGTTGILPPKKGTTERDSVLFLLNF